MTCRTEPASTDGLCARRRCAGRGRGRGRRGVRWRGALRLGLREGGGGAPDGGEGDEAQRRAEEEGGDGEDRLRARDGGGCGLGGENGLRAERWQRRAGQRLDSRPSRVRKWFFLCGGRLYECERKDEAEAPVLEEHLVDNLWARSSDVRARNLKQDLIAKCGSVSLNKALPAIYMQIRCRADKARLTATVQDIAR